MRDTGAEGKHRQKRAGAGRNRQKQAGGGRKRLGEARRGCGDRRGAAAPELSSTTIS